MDTYLSKVTRLEKQGLQDSMEARITGSYLQGEVAEMGGPGPEQCLACPTAAVEVSPAVKKICRTKESRKVSHASDRRIPSEPAAM